MVHVTPKQCGKNVRMNFGKINEVLEMPNLIEVQKNSYKWFREKGLREVFRDVSSITDYNGNLVLNFTDYRIDDTPKYTIAECKERDVTYAAPLRVTATLWNKETGEVKESEIFMGDFPPDDRKRHLCHQRCRTCYRFPAGAFAGRILRFGKG